MVVLLGVNEDNDSVTSVENTMHYTKKRPALESRRGAKELVHEKEFVGAQQHLTQAGQS
jgi:hypothetical protein